MGRCIGTTEKKEKKKQCFRCSATPLPASNPSRPPDCTIHTKLLLYP